MTAPIDRGQPDVFARYLERTRWFAGKGRPFAVDGGAPARRAPGQPGTGCGW